MASVLGQNKGQQNRSYTQNTSNAKPRVQSANVASLRDLRQGMINNAKFGKMVMYSVECMGKMAVDQVSVEEICESGCIDAALDACKLSAKNETLQHQVNSALLRSGLDDHCVVQLSKSINHKFEPFKTSLDSHTTPETLRSTSKVLCMLAGAPDPEGKQNIDKMKEQGIFESVIQRIRSSPVDDADTLASLTNILSYAADNNDVAQSAINNGVFTKLLHSIVENPTNKDLATAFAKLTAKAVLAGDNIVAQLKANGIADGFTTLLKLFPNDKEIAAAAKSSLSLLSNATEVAPLVAQLRNTTERDSNGYSDDELMYQRLQATANLAALTLVRPNIAFFKGGNGIDALTSSYSAVIRDIRHLHAQNVHIPGILLDSLTQSALLLGNISRNGTQHQIYAIMKEGGVQHLTDALQLIQQQYIVANKNNDQQLMASLMNASVATFGALCALMTKAENVAYLDQNGHIVAAIMATQGLRHDVQTLEALTDLILRSLDFMDQLSPETLRVMQDAIIDIIHSGIIPDDPVLCSKLAQMISLLALEEGIETEFIQAGVVEYLINMMKKYIDNPDVVLSCLRGLELAAQTSLGAERLLALKADQLLVEIKKLHRNNPDILDVCNTILSLCEQYKQGLMVPYNTHGANTQHGATENIQGPGYSVNVGMQMMQTPRQGQALQRGMTHLNIEEEQMQQQQQQRYGMNQLDISDDPFMSNGANGLDIMSQLRAFGLGSGFAAIPTDASASAASAYALSSEGTGVSSSSQDNTSSALSLEQTSTTTSTQIMSEHALMLVETVNRVQLFITERRAAKLLSMFESFFMQPPSYDRDYILNAILDGIASVCEEGYLCEQQYADQGDVITDDIKPYLNTMGYSLVFNELEQGLIENRVGLRLCDHMLTCQDEYNLVVLSDDFATLLSLITRDVVSIVHVKSGLRPQFNQNVGTEEQPYVSSNEDLSIASRIMGIQQAATAFEDAYNDLMEQYANEREQLAIARSLQVEKMKQLTEKTISNENAIVLARIQEAKRIAEEKAKQQREEIAQRLEAIKKQQNEQYALLNKEAEERRLRQIDEILAAARAATAAKVDLERSIAMGVDPKARVQRSALDPKIKEYLVTGVLVTKHGELKGPSPRHLYITSNLEYLVYRHSGTTEVKKSQMMKLTRFHCVKQGRHTNALRILARPDDEPPPPPPKDDTCDGEALDIVRYEADLPNAAAYSPFFVLYGLDSSGQEREISFEVGTSAECLKLCKALNHLAEFQRGINEFHEDTLQMHSNPLHNISVAEKQLASLVQRKQKITANATTSGLNNSSTPEPSYNNYNSTNSYDDGDYDDNDDDVPPPPAPPPDDEY